MCNIGINNLTVLSLNKCKTVGKTCFLNFIGSFRWEVQETQSPSRLDLYRDCGSASSIIISSISSIAFLSSTTSNKILDDIVSFIGREPNILFIRISDRYSKLEQGIRWSTFSCYFLFNLQPALAVIPCPKQIITSTCNLIFFATDDIVICSFSARRILIFYEHGCYAVDDHWVVDLAGQLPSIVSFIRFRLNDFIIMSCL